MMARRFLIVFALCLVVGCTVKVEPIPVEPPPPPVDTFAPLGTVLVSRNNDEELNTSPGHMNHLCIYVGDNRVVESQEDDGGVIFTSLQEYGERDYKWFALYPCDLEVGAHAAWYAKRLVDLPYRERSSLHHFHRDKQKGLNCVSVVRLSYEHALECGLPHLKFPDHAVAMKDVFTRKRPREFDNDN